MSDLYVDDPTRRPDPYGRAGGISQPPPQYQQNPPLLIPAVDAEYGKRIENRLSRIEIGVWLTLGVASVGTLIAGYFLYEFIRLAVAIHNALNGVS